MINIKTPNFLFGSFYSSLKNAILKKVSVFTTYVCKLTILVCYFFLKKRYFSNVELFQLLVGKKNRSFLYITINYYEDASSFFDVCLLYSKTYTKYISLKKLMKISKVERTIYVLSTSRGIYNTSEAIMYKTGGIPLLEFF
jgi:ribosomal protein S8